MKTNNELIAIWNQLPPQEKMAMGDHYITHETNLKAWDKPFKELSPLKQKRVLQSIEEFSKVKFHGIIGSGIDTNLVNISYKKIKKELNLTDADIAEFFDYKNANSFATSSAKNRIEKGLTFFYAHSKKAWQEKINREAEN